MPSAQPLSGAGHGDHGAGATDQSTAAGPSFSSALALAVGRSPGTGGGAAPVGVVSAAHAAIHPRHFPIGGAPHEGGRGVHETALGLRAYRQQLIASNMANADTPGYKAVDIDFREALRIARAAAATPPLALATTAAGHVVGQATSPEPPYPLAYHVPLQASADGNTVEMDVERAKFAENEMMYGFSLDRVSGHFKHMMEMLQNLKG